MGDRLGTIVHCDHARKADHGTLQQKRDRGDMPILAPRGHGVTIGHVFLDLEPDRKTLEHAGMAELVDALASEAGVRKDVGVRLPLPVPGTTIRKVNNDA